MEQEIVPGPVLEANVRVVKIIVKSLEENKEQKIVDDPIEIKEALGLFSAYSWKKNQNNPLLPLYKIDLHKEAGKYSTYWLGSYSNPPRFPCYSFCSGWWLAASGEDGNIDRTRYTSLASSGAMLSVGKLLDNSLTMQSKQDAP